MTHVLLESPELRRELRGKVGNTFNSMSTFLEEPGEAGWCRFNNTPRTKAVDTVLDFAEASQRFQIRAS